jgi:DNA-binding CsgD family transcriptional regulator
MAWSPERLIDEVDLLGARGLPQKELFAELAPRLRNVISNDASCWHTLDPHTRLMTSDSPDELIERGVFAPDEAPAAGELLVRSEYIVEDVNTFAGLAARRVPVGILDHVTRGDPQRSARYRDLLLPAGIPHELRAAFVIRGRVWGAVHIARRVASGPFEQRDVDALAGVAGAIARGIRASLRFDAARRATASRRRGSSSSAHGTRSSSSRRRRANCSPRCAPTDRPTPTMQWPRPCSRSPRLSAARPRPVKADRTSSRFPAATAGSPSTGRCPALPATAASPSSSSGARSATVRLEAFGATAREREVATLLARGLSRAEMAEALVLSPHTVEDHVKNLYEKLGVASRQELVARVFLDEYLPEVARQTPLTSRGRFARQ